MKKYYFLIIVALILGLVLAGCSLLSNVGQVPSSEQSGISYLTKGPSPDLVGLWHFSGNALDSSGNGNNGTVYGATYVGSPMGQALSFGGSDYVYVPDSDSLDITRATLETWIKPNVTTQTGYARIVFKGTNSPFVPLYFLAYDSTGKYMRMVVFIGGVAKEAVSTTTLTDTNKWYHIAGTYDGTDVKIYVDDALEGTTSVPADGEIDTGPQDLGIGRNTEANSYGYKGLIDEVRIWKTALTATQLGDITPPVITLLGSTPVTVEVGSVYTDAGATADITDSIIVGGLPVDTAVLGTYTVTYNVTDSSGNAATQVTRTVNVVDTTAPVIAMLGTSPVTVVVGSTYTDAGATATDNYDGDITGSIVTVSTVDTSTVGIYTVTYNVKDSSGNAAETVTRIVNVIYHWTGFFRPVDNLPTWNAAKAGSAIPVKFSLSGYQGLSIFATGYPKSDMIPCESTDLVAGVDETATAGGSILSYDATVDQYVYVWKTSKLWAGTCRQLVVLLNDGTFQRANFTFTK